MSATLRGVLLALFTGGCVPPLPGPSPDPSPPPTAETVVTPATGSTTSTGNTGHTGDTGIEIAPDCDAPTAAYVKVHPLLVFEDFDFLPSGTLVTGANQFLMTYDAWADDGMIGFGLGINPTGVRVLANEDIVVADVQEGSVDRVDGQTGAVSNLISGLANPNGIAAVSDGTFYVSEHVDGGRVLHVDPDSGEVTEVVRAAADEAPNGLALSVDESVLLVAMTSHLASVALSDATITELYAFDEEFTAVAVDACDNVYIVSFFTGKLVRISPNGTAELLYSLGVGSVSSLRFGNGADGLPRNHLYAGQQHSGVHEIFIGIDGVAPAYAR